MERAQYSVCMAIRNALGVIKACQRHRTMVFGDLESISVGFASLDQYAPIIGATPEQTEGVVAAYREFQDVERGVEDESRLFTALGASPNPGVEHSILNKLWTIGYEMIEQFEAREFRGV